jgi:hypothetical protein
MLSRRTGADPAVPPESQPSRSTDVPPLPVPGKPASDALSEILWGTKRRQGMVEVMAKQAARTVGSQVGRQILRGVLGSILGGSRRG